MIPFNIENPQSNFIILIAGRIVHWKGFNIAILAFKGLLKELEKAKMIIIGNGPEQNYLKKSINNLKISDSIIMYPNISYKNYLEILKIADVFIYPSLHEPGAFVLLEALTANKKIICFKYGEPDTLISDKDGIKINYGDGVEKFTEALIKIHNNDKNNNKSFIKNINEMFFWDKKGIFIKKEIENILDENSPSS